MSSSGAFRKQTVLTTFVHGYPDEKTMPKPSESLPALWAVHSDHTDDVYSYKFLITEKDFGQLDYPFAGEMPLQKTSGFKKAPRYGFTGIKKVGRNLIAGSWNGFYILDAKSFKVKRFLSNRFTSYIHRFDADSKMIVFAVPFMDMVVRMDYNANIIDVRSIDLSLNVTKIAPNQKTDWRFVGKVWKGPTGYYHFNNVQMIGDKIYLTARNINAFVVLDPKTPSRASLRTANYTTTACIHDGDYYKGKFYFTSIDGKFLVCEPHSGGKKEIPYHRDLVAETVYVQTISKNWCRGIKVTPSAIYTTMDGVYGGPLHFSLVCFDPSFKKLWSKRFKHRYFSSNTTARYIAGFDIETI